MFPQTAAPSGRLAATLPRSRRGRAGHGQSQRPPVSARSMRSSTGARVTAWRRAGSEVEALPRSLHARFSLAASVPAPDLCGSQPCISDLPPLGWLSRMLRGSGLGLAGPKAHPKPRMEKLCPVPGCRVDHVTRPGPQAVNVVVHGAREEPRCPGCRQASRAVHSRYVRRPADLPAASHTVWISLQARRFYCRNTSCPRRTFAERFPKLLTPSARAGSPEPRRRWTPPWAGKLAPSSCRT